MKTPPSPELAAHGKTISELAGRLANGDAGQQLHILLQAVASFVSQYSAAERLLGIAIDCLIAARDAAAEFARDHAS